MPRQASAAGPKCIDSSWTTALCVIKCYRSRHAEIAHWLVHGNHKREQWEPQPRDLPGSYEHGCKSSQLRYKTTIKDIIDPYQELLPFKYITIREAEKGLVCISFTASSGKPFITTISPTRHLWCSHSCNKCGTMKLMLVITEGNGVEACTYTSIKMRVINLSIERV